MKVIERENKQKIKITEDENIDNKEKKVNIIQN